MSCEEFRNVVEYDKWAAPHQLLPFSATLMGINPREVVIFMYLWETLEVLMFNCLGWAEIEECPNSLVSDPFQAFVGIIVGVGINRAMATPFDQFTTIQSYMASAFCILPSFVFLIPDYEWTYIAALPFAIAIVAIVASGKRAMTFPWSIFSFIYIATVSVCIFTLHDTFNSFYTAILTGLAFGVSVHVASMCY